MLTAILLLLIVFWFLGYGPFAVLSIALFSINGRVISLWDILIFLVLIWLIDTLPSPFREIGVVLFIIWILSTLGIIAIVAFPKIIILAVIGGVLLYILSGR